jgi:hypothetical protein
MFELILDLAMLGAVYGGIRHYTHHNCIALVAVIALVYLKDRR